MNDSRAIFRLNYDYICGAREIRGDAKFNLTEHPVYDVVRAQPVTSRPREINVS